MQRLDELLAPQLSPELTSIDIRELRAIRAECQEFEAALSYLRRVAQGRLDIVAAEMSRRAQGGEPLDVAELVTRLPEILADRVRAPGVGRLPQLMAPAEADVADVLAELDDMVPVSKLTLLGELSDTELTDLAASLSEYEARVSKQRRSLHDRIDALQAELTRRYKTGEASVESLLS